LENEPVLTPAQWNCVKAIFPDLGIEACAVSLAGQAGSQRTFIRVKEKEGRGRSCILVVWDSKDEDWLRFLSIPRELMAHAPFFPVIFHADSRHGLIVEEDLGSETLKQLCERDNTPEAIESAYRKVLDAIALWHRLDIRLSTTISARALDLETFMWETDYFARRCVVDFCGAEHLLTNGWEKERKSLAARAAALPKCFVHRDFQSENVMVIDENIKFVDFQGARLGPPAYDLASLLYDPYSDLLHAELVEKLFDYYCGLDHPVTFDRPAFDICAAQRLMQALGAYGNLSIHHGKSRYRAFVPVALTRLCRVLKRLPEYPVMAKIARECRETVMKSMGKPT
jgi:hypothetical protein